MFWKQNNISSPHFEAVLQKEGVTLQELMEEEDIIQECKIQNKKLVDFLCKREVLEELVTFITEEPPEELDERSRFKYPNIACELLTCDVPALNESLSRDNELLEKLYSFIDKEPPLNPLLASFLSRTLGVLIVKRPDQHWISYQFTCLQAMGFLKDKENFISLLLKHLGTSAIMDLTLKLITEVGDVEHRQNLLNWLDSQRLVQSLVALFDPKVDSERHHNASQLICDVLRISRDILNDHRDRLDTDPILARLESPETVALLLDHMLGTEKSESSVVGGIQVLLALLGHKNSFNDNLAYNTAYDEAEIDRKQKVANSTAHVIVERLKDFHQILLDPPKKSVLKTSIGALDPPLGNTRLQVTKLLAALIALDHAEILREIIKLGIVEVLLDLFFKYVWNNFLHAQVQQCIAAALVAHVKPNESEDETSDNIMHPYLIIKCRLLDRVLEAWEDNEQKQSKPKGVRQGYMGHLINIANEIILQCQENSSLDNFLTENVGKDTLEAWNNFVNSSLAETNKTQRVILGGVHPRTLTSDDSNDDYNIPYAQSAILQQQIYNEFQMQQMPSDIIENCGFNDEFNDPDDILSPRDRRVNINLNNSELCRQAEMFKKVCSEYVTTLDDADDAIFEEESIACGTTTPSMDKWDPRDSDTEEASPREDPRMEVDPWPKVEGSNTIPLAEPSNPWATLDSSKTSAQEDGWADFGSFVTSFESPPPKDINFESQPSPDPSASFSAANPQDIQSSGDQKIESRVEDIKDSTDANLKTDDSEKVADQVSDNHPEEPVSHEEPSKFVATVSTNESISVPVATSEKSSAPEPEITASKVDVAVSKADVDVSNADVSASASIDAPVPISSISPNDEVQSAATESSGNDVASATE